MQIKPNHSHEHPDAVIYIRVATRTGNNVVEQEAEARAYCAMRGLTVETVVLDEGISGLTPLEGRNGGRALLAALKDGSLQHLVTQDFARLSRDETAVEALRSAFNDAGVELHLVTAGRFGSALPEFLVASAVANPSRPRKAHRRK